MRDMLLIVIKQLTVVQEIAVKMEHCGAPHPQLLYESKLYKILAGGVGIPNTR
jgi:hypothetical protein